MFAGYLGKIRHLSDRPAGEKYSPQPMVTQTGDVLENHKANGSSFEKVVIDGTGHPPHIE